jgi:hypothetical protein
MKLYRVTFHTSLLVEAESEEEAERIGYKNLKCEDVSELWNIEPIEEVTQLMREERGTLPWRSIERLNEPLACVEEILVGRK